MSLAKISENPVVTGTDGGRGAANLNYILYIVGFFTGITAVIGVALAYSNRDTASENVRSHFDWQIKIFWRSVRFFVVLTILYLLIFVIGVFTLGLGFILFLIPFAIWLWWLISTINRIAKGMKALGLGQPVGRLSGKDSGFAPASGAPVAPPPPVASVPPAGWYADSARVGQTRWWNGKAWGMRDDEYPTTARANPGADLGGANGGPGASGSSSPEVGPGHADEVEIAVSSAGLAQTGHEPAVIASVVAASSEEAPITASTPAREPMSAPTPAMRFCENCGAARNPGGRFCTSCGHA